MRVDCQLCFMINFVCWCDWIRCVMADICHCACACIVCCMVDFFLFLWLSYVFWSWCLLLFMIVLCASWLISEGFDDCPKCWMVDFLCVVIIVLIVYGWFLMCLYYVCFMCFMDGFFCFMIVLCVIWLFSNVVVWLYYVFAVGLLCALHDCRMSFIVDFRRLSYVIMVELSSVLYCWFIMSFLIHLCIL